MDGWIGSLNKKFGSFKNNKFHLSFLDADTGYIGTKSFILDGLIRLFTDQ